ncbi:permease [Desulfosporosinus sp. BICA1-9]|uniref:permease n=1 Tax=Desulfosporosinus sp. BICA1-9 TaxID=1531958 RepID=UPI00054C000D|nr:permease [Desulfosporosinus sp. BICA1-9]KJS48724.1 MAG: permease [Peptococcaceae bacterium BRH_c23]KJS90615.1 MAG: permease [Desulfosporosinus sp. BICA1-9]HBW34637.1 permease [Desulfosporosinus sp.]
MKTLLKRYKYFLGLIILNIIVYALYPSTGQTSIDITWSNAIEMLSILPPIFILLGLLDVWVKRETMIKLMGEKSGILGVLIAFFLGSAAAGPLYAAFPIAGVLLQKESKLSNVLIFLGAWSTTKIPMLLFEASAMGWKFMMTRFVINIPVIILIAYITGKLLNEREKKYIYNSAGSI